MAEVVVGEKDTTRERDSLRNKEAKRRTPEVKDGGAQKGGTVCTYVISFHVRFSIVIVIVI